MNVWITQPGKVPQQTELFAENKRYTKWLVKESSYKYLLQLHDQLQRQGLYLS